MRQWWDQKWSENERTRKTTRYDNLTLNELVEVIIYKKSLNLSLRQKTHMTLKLDSKWMYSECAKCADCTSDHNNCLTFEKALILKQKHHTNESQFRLECTHIFVNLSLKWVQIVSTSCELRCFSSLVQSSVQFSAFKTQSDCSILMINT